MKREVFVASGGKEISLAVWDNVSQPPKGVVQLLHGISEHILRYDEFAAHLNACGYIVVGSDHRGHGETDKDASGIAEVDVFQKVVCDNSEIAALLHDRYAIKPVLVGYGYGAYIVMRCLQTDVSCIGGAVLCGSAFVKGVKLDVALLRIKRKLEDFRDAPCTEAARRFEAYDKRFNEGIGGWLNRDTEAVGAYNVDSMCGFVCSNAYYYSFLEGIKTIFAENAVCKEVTFPILILSGDNDATAKGGRLTERLRAWYESAGVRVRCKLYGGARHDIFREINRVEVFCDIARFLDSASQKN